MDVANPESELPQEGERSTKPTKSERERLRMFYSCSLCRRRKVKCDRIKPCSACCLRKRPSECVYEIMPGQDNQYTTQDDAIEKLRNEVKDLQTQLAKMEQEKRDFETAVQLLPRTEPVPNPHPPSSPNGPLDALFQILLSASPGVVSKTISEIRKGSALQDVMVSTGTQSDGRGVRRAVTKRKVRKRVDQSASQGVPRSTRQLPPALKQMPLVLESLIGRFISFLDPGDDATGEALRSLCRAADMRVHSQLLLHAYQAASIMALGRSVPGPSLIKLGHQIYGNALGALQHALVHPSQSRATETFVTVILLAAVEVHKRTSERAIVGHLSGVLRLLEFRGPDSHMFGVAHGCFVGMRPYWVIAALISRKPTFLATKEWKSIPWSSGTSEKDTLQHLLDIVADVPTLLYQYDEFRKSVLAGQLSPTDISSTQAMLGVCLSDMEQRLHMWKRNWADVYPHGQLVEVPYQAEENFPIFLCRDPTTTDLMMPTTFRFPDVLLTEAMCLYWTTLLILAAVNVPGNETAIPPQARYMYACNICRSVKEHIRMARGPMIIRLTMSLRVVLEYFEDGSAEHGCVKEFFLAIGHQMGSPAVKKMAPELSIRTKH